MKQEVLVKVKAPLPDNSDPIQPFSSSPSSLIEDRALMPPRGRSASLRPSARTPSPIPAPLFQPTGLLGFNTVHAVGDSSDEDMPDVGSLLHDDAKSRGDQERKQRLAEVKRRALAQQQTRATPSDGDDSDLEIVQDDMHAVAREEAQVRRANAAHGVRRSIGKHAQLAMAGVRPRKSSATAMPSLAAAPTFLRKRPHDGAEVQLTAQQLKHVLFENARKQAALETQQKEEHWRRVGGKIKSRTTDEAPGLHNAILDYAQRVAQAGAEADEDDEEEDADDPDYQPADEDQQLQLSGNEVDSDADNQQVPPSQSQTVVVEESKNDIENDENASPVLRGRTGRPRRSLIAVHSDDEEEASLGSLGKVLVADSSFVLPTPQQAAQGMLRHRASTSSLEGPIEGGTDKENDATLAYGDDKENVDIASQPSAFNRATSFFSLSQGRPPLMLSAGGPTESTLHDGRRTPFQELRTGDDDDLSLSMSSNRRGPARRLTFTPDLPLQIEENEPQQIGSGSPSPIRPVVFKGGLADLFESQASQAAPSPIAPKAIQGGGLADFFSQESVSCICSERHTPPLMRGP